MLVAFRPLSLCSCPSTWITLFITSSFFIDTGVRNSYPCVNEEQRNLSTISCCERKGWSRSGFLSNAAENFQLKILVKVPPARNVKAKFFGAKHHFAGKYKKEQLPRKRQLQCLEGGYPKVLSKISDRKFQRLVIFWILWRDICPPSRSSAGFAKPFLGCRFL